MAILIRTQTNHNDRSKRFPSNSDVKRQALSGHETSTYETQPLLLRAGASSIVPHRKKGKKKKKNKNGRVRNCWSLKILSSVMSSSALRRPIFRLSSSVTRHISQSATVAAVAHDIQPAQTPFAQHGSVAPATQRGEEFWRRVPVFENVAGSEFLSYKWSVSSNQTLLSRVD